MPITGLQPSPFAVAIVGQANVGKSTLFNRLTSSRAALVADCPGVTRDRQYGEALCQGRRFCFIDTGGIGETSPRGSKTTDLRMLMHQQAVWAIQEARLLLWVVDGRSGLGTTDHVLVNELRRQGKPVVVLVNKMEGMDAVATAITLADYAFGFPSVHSVSARHGEGIAAVWDVLCAYAGPPIPPTAARDNEAQEKRTTVVAIVGRPNAGKSTLVNRLLGVPRMLTRDEPGTTRDSIHMPCSFQGQDYFLIDTAGVRRQARITDTVERLGVSRALQAARKAHVVLFLIDAKAGVTEQDRSLLGRFAQQGCPIIIAANKCDILQGQEKHRFKTELARSCGFILHYVPVHHISALEGKGLAAVFRSVQAIMHSLRDVPSATDMTAILHRAVVSHPPPAVGGRRAKLRYAHIGGLHPVRVIVHGNRTRYLPDTYLRYLSRVFREQLRLVSVPVLVECQQNRNPYQSGKGGGSPGRLGAAG